MNKEKNEPSFTQLLFGTFFTDYKPKKLHLYEYNGVYIGNVRCSTKFGDFLTHSIEYGRARALTPTVCRKQCFEKG